ncbi:MAG TPA: hypothetical protein VGO87_09585 [Acidimicrobiia bacterium]
MRITIARIGATGAGAVLALGLVAFTPAAGATAGGNHGINSQDSTCFTAGGPQGKSHSDPDGMSNGGADKPGCPGGFDADQDGNNGCGNDADREDDNNGHCGRQKTGAADEGGTAPSAPTSPSTTSTSTSTTSTTTSTTTGPPPTVAPAVELTDCQVDPKEATDCPAAAQGTTGAHLTVAGTTADAGGAATDATTTTPTTAPGTEVLGEQISRPSALARTGAGVGAMALLGLVLCGSGRLAVLARRLLRIG